jgi:competence protein ComFC
MINLVKDITNLFYPEECLICCKTLTEHEIRLCLACRLDLPLTNFSANEGNEMEISFYGRVPIINATSLFYYNRKGNVQKLIHQLKYKNQQKIGFFLGEWLGEEMLGSERFNGLDCIIPVPMHPKKLKKRGYNQVITFGQGLSKRMKIPLNEIALISISKTKTQTFKTRLERSTQIDEKFQLSNQAILEGKHILLIDDVITTGATLEACCIPLMQVKNIKITIATIAVTV